MAKPFQILWLSGYLPSAGLPAPTGYFHCVEELGEMVRAGGKWGAGLGVVVVRRCLSQPFQTRGPE